MNRACKIFIFILGLWLGLSCFLDFFAVPTVFRTLPSRELAGKLGMIFFYTFNKLEIVLSLALAVSAYCFRDKVVWKKTFWASLSVVFALVCLHTFHMTPTIIDVNKKKYELMEDSAEFITLNKKHQSYHNLFKGTDGTKILILIFLFGTTLKRREEEV